MTLWQNPSSTGLQYRCVMKARSLPRREMYRMLKKEMKTLTAERVYEVLKKEEFSETKLGQLEVRLPCGRSQLLAER